MYHAAPLRFAGFIHSLGGTVVMARQFDAEAALAAIERYGVTHTHMVPTQFRRLLLLPEQVRAAADCSSLRCVIHGAAPCDVTIKQSMMGWWGPIVWEYYGTTEGGGTIADPHQWLAHPGTVGLPYPGADVRVLDDDGEQVPAGTPGTVYFHVVWSDFEYLHDPGKTRDNRRGDYVTVGDLGYLDDEGFLYLLGRSVELIISAGVNVYPAEIESRLVNHPAVADVAVVGEPDDDRGEVPVAHVELAPGAVAGPELVAELHAHCAAELAAFKLPRRFVFVDALPRDPSGKLLKRKLVHPATA
jgi:long-chain acyl-CoA synthetase